MFAHIGLFGVGIIVSRGLKINPGYPERVASSNTPIDGPNIHFVSEIEDSQYEVTGTIATNDTGKAMLVSLYESATVILDLDASDCSYKGYLKRIVLERSSRGKHFYTFQFNVTTKIK